MRWFSSLGAVAVAVAVATPVQALVGPYYGYGSVSAVSGHADATSPYGSDTTDYNKTGEGTTPLSLATGNRWWCEAGDPGCGVVNPPGSDASGWAEVSVDPAAATLGGLARAFHDPGPVGPHCVPNPFGSGQICQPQSFWGYAGAWAYASQLYEVASDGSLAAGDPVTVSGTLHLAGDWRGDPTIVGDRTEAMAILHRLGLGATQPWFFEGSGAINSLSSYLDLITIPEWNDGLLASAGTMAAVPMASVVAGGFPDHTAVDQSYPFTADVQVGDILLLQSFLDVEVTLDNDQLYHDVEGDLLHTAGTSLAATTAGALLLPRSGVVPEPMSLLLVASGVGAAFVARRRSM